jgi:hypothetical protein
MRTDAIQMLYILDPLTQFSGVQYRTNDTLLRWTYKILPSIRI